jgi:acetyltransferase-like isoleucine patch superfamily enzyme
MEKSPLNTPTLSICIPTYNRSSLLRETLQSICDQTVFKNTAQVEIVVSDNGSSDDTFQIVQEFISFYGDKIVYNRNDKNILDLNFYKAICIGRGTFLKLNNDTAVHKNGSLDLILSLVAKFDAEKPQIFFSNSRARGESKVYIGKELQEFMQLCSYFTGWIGGFGIWRDDAPTMEMFFEKNWASQLSQVETILDLVNRKQSFAVVDVEITRTTRVSKVSPSSLSKIYGKNYAEILRPFVDRGTLTREFYDSEMQRVIEQLIFPYFFSLNDKFDTFHFLDYLQEWQSRPYFFKSFERMFFETHKVPEEGRDLRNPAICERLWRLLNRHNRTTAQTAFDYKKVRVGRKTYGPLRVHEWGSKGEFLNIGNFCSIAHQVNFLLGGNHVSTGVSTFPFKVMVQGDKNVEAYSKGAIIVEDDVWIGFDTVVLSGARIGRGSIIAAGSVVTGEVPPYSIYGGRPGRVLKARFSEKIIMNLMKIDFGCLTDEKIKSELDHLYTTVTEGNVEEIVERLNSAFAKKDFEYPA